jgi:Na+-transporting NADH:ubiquinone oxidoreductase subunit C
VRNSNNYIILFAVIVTVISAILLASAATLLKPMQDANLLKEKQQNILSVVGKTADDDYKNFDQLIEGIVVNEAGDVVDGIDPMSLDLAMEKKLKSKNSQHKLNYPLYIYTNEAGEKTYILQLAGTGLWGPIWGYLALDADGNTVKQVVFDHKGETPGLGAEINTEGFESKFSNKKIFSESGDFTSVKVAKGVFEAGDPYQPVDAISGGTITSNGVSQMLAEDIKFYLAYIQKQKNL